MSRSRVLSLSPEPVILENAPNVIVSHMLAAALNTLEKIFSTNPSKPCFSIPSSRENTAPIIPPILLPASENASTRPEAMFPIWDKDISEELPSWVIVSANVIRFCLVLSALLATFASAF